MPRYKDFNVCVKSNNEALSEYGDGVDTQDSTRNTYLCWVASEEGKQFSVHYECETDDVNYRVIIYVDGIRTAGSLVVSRDRKGGCSEGVNVDARTLRPYMFSSVELTDDESLADIRVQASNIGEITVKIFRVEVRKKYRPSFKGNNGSTFIPDGMIHEGKKVSGHRTVLGGMIQKNRRNRNSLPPSAKYTWFGLGDESEKQPYVTFKFFYRPELTLQAQGLIPVTAREERGQEEKLDNTAVEQMLFLPSPSRFGPPDMTPVPGLDNMYDSPDHSAVKRRVREVIDLSVDVKREALATIQYNAGGVKNSISGFQGKRTKGEPRPTKREIIDLTLE